MTQNNNDAIGILGKHFAVLAKKTFGGSVEIPEIVYSRVIYSWENRYPVLFENTTSDDISDRKFIR